MSSILFNISIAAPISLPLKELSSALCDIAADTSSADTSPSSYLALNALSSLVPVVISALPTSTVLLLKNDPFAINILVCNTGGIPVSAAGSLVKYS